MSRKFIIIPLLFIFMIACGTLRMDLDSKVKNLEDFSHTFEIIATDELAMRKFNYFLN